MVALPELCLPLPLVPAGRKLIFSFIKNHSDFKLLAQRKSGISLAKASLGGAMETQLQSCYFTKKGPVLITLFGYASKSVPGLEINGLGKYGKAIKEKIVYITRSRGLQIPLKRFVLNVEYQDELGDLESSSVKYLEYPLLLHYWFLAGLLPITKLDNCLALGSLNPSGVVEEPLSDSVVELCELNHLHLISSHTGLESAGGIIDGKDLFGSIAHLEFKWQAEVS